MNDVRLKLNISKNTVSKRVKPDKPKFENYKYA